MIAVLVGVVLTVAISEIALRFIYPHWHEFYAGRFMEPDFVPGYGQVYVGRPGFDGYFAQNNGDFRARIHINAAGLRDDEPVQKANGRIWIVGDSMAFGWGVERNETYTSVFQRLSGLPAYNVASPGADVCGYQALVARMPTGAKPRAVIVGLILENDIHVYDCVHGAGPKTAPAGTEPRRFPPTLAQVKYFLTGASALYNVLAVAIKRSAMINDLLIRFGLVARPHAYRGVFRTGNVDARIASTVAEVAWLRKILPPGTPFAVLVCPARHEIRDDDPFFAALRTQTVTALKANNIDVIDPVADFKAIGFTAAHFAHDGHWSASGHETAAKVITRWAKGALK